MPLCLGNSNFQVLPGDVDLGPMSQRPELFKVAALQNEVANVTDDQQTAVVTVGVDFRLDWSSWVTQMLGADSLNVIQKQVFDADSLSATYQYMYYRTHLSESGRIIGPVVELQPQYQLPARDRVVVRANMERHEFYVEITCAVVADRAVYELEVCLPQSDNKEKCRSSNMTVYIIERPKPLGIYL